MCKYCSVCELCIFDVSVIKEFVQFSARAEHVPCIIGLKCFQTNYIYSINICILRRKLCKFIAKLCFKKLLSCRVLIRDLGGQGNRRRKGHIRKEGGERRQ